MMQAIQLFNDISLAIFFGLAYYLLAGHILLTATPAHSYIVGRGGENGAANNNHHTSNNILSRFDFQCKLHMIVGRTPNTDMPPEWAASGAKLGLPLHVRFSTTECQSDEKNQESLLLLAEGRQADDRILPSSTPFCTTVLPLNEPSFTSSMGHSTVKVTQGAFSCQSQVLDTAQYSFRFFLDFPEGASRNDVVLPAGRVFFMTACWNEDTNLIERARKVKVNNAKLIHGINTELMNMGANTKSILANTSRYVSLVERRKKLSSQISMLDEAFPPDERLVKGPNNISFLREGVISVKRKIGRQEKYIWIGTFTLGEFTKHDRCSTMDNNK